MTSQPSRSPGFRSIGAEATQPEDVRTLALRVLVAQPFSDLLGIRLERAQRGLVELRLSTAPFLLQQSGMVHSGVLATTSRARSIWPH